jgi:hypothetical protein
MATTDQITLLIKAEVNKAVADLKKVDKGLDDLDKQSKKTSKSGGLLSSAFAKMALSAGAVAAAYKAVIEPAIDLEESQNRFSTLFRENTDLANKWADTLVDSYAMSRREAFDSLSAFQSMLKPLDMSAESAGVMSNRFAQLAADLGSFNNVPTADVVRDLRSALAGSTETVEKYGSNIKIATLKQFALNQGLWDGVSAFEGATKANAILQKVISDTADAQGDMIRTSDSLANTIKKVKARLQDVAATIGSQAMPGMKDLAKAVGDLLDKESSFVGFLTSVGKILSGIASTAAAAVKGFSALATMVDISMGDMSQAVGEAKIKENLEGLTSSLKDAGKSFKEAFTGEDEVEEFLEIDGKLERVTDNVIRSTQKTTEARKQATKEQLKAAQDARAKFEEMRRTETENKILKIQEEHARIRDAKILNDEELRELDRVHTEQMWDVRVQMAQENMQKISEMTGMFTNTLQKGFQLDQKLREKQLDKEYQKKRQRIIATVKDEDEQKKQLAKLDEDFDKKKRKLKTDAAKKEKGIAIAEATINTAASVVSMLKAGFPVGIIMAALAAAMGAAQIAMIAATPIPAAAEGGVIPGTTAGTLIQAGENAASEAILPLENEQAQEKIGEALGGARGSTTINMNVNNLYATEEVPENMAIAIDQALLNLKQGGQSAFAESIIEEQV